MLATFREAKDYSALRDISGKCPGGLGFRDLLNEATSRLMRRGDWDGTIVPVYVCAYGGCVVFSRYVGQVRALKVCNRDVPVKNDYDAFHVFGHDWRREWRGWCGNDVRMLGSNRSPVKQDVEGDGRLIRAYARCNADIGKKLTIFGTDNNGQALFHFDDLGNAVDGVTIELTKPFVSTDKYVRHIDRVLKDKTQCPVDVYAYNVAKDVLEPISHYEPSETNPAYAKYQLQAGCCANLKSLVALVKLQFVPVENDTDLVLIENLDALADFMQSLRYRKAGDTQSANEYEASAIRELNLDLWSRDQEQAVTVHIEPFNDIDTRQHCF